MKKLFLFISFLYSMGAGALYFPLALTPESLQSIRGGYDIENKTPYLNAELILHGNKKKVLEGVFGDFLKFNHSLSVGLNLSLHDAKQRVLYGTAYVYLDTADSIQAGVKQIIFNEDEVKGITYYFFNYYFDSKNIFFKNEQEFLSIYIGFLSPEFSFKKEEFKEILNKATDFKQIYKKYTLGLYYDWDVTDIFSLGLESNLKDNVWLNLYFNIL